VVPRWKQIAYTVLENGKFSIRRRFLDGSRPEQVLYQNEIYADGDALDWSPDGIYLSLDLHAKDGTVSNWILPLKDGGEPFRSSPTPAGSISQYDGLFSPDGHWLAYFSYESARPEVYVVPFRTGGAKQQVSITGGWLPRFSRRNELFFVTMGNRVMLAKQTKHANFHVESIRPMLQVDFPNFASPLWDVSADGERFAVLTADHAKSTSIALVTNWPAELKK
jgi:Tol biopolymer transport system component